MLKKHWGHPSLYPTQKELILGALRGEDVLGILPTNGGKSLVFQIPVLCKKGLGIVFSPLLSLMASQVEDLRRRGIRAAYLHHKLSPKEQTYLLDACRHGKLSFLYLAPERLRSHAFVACLKTLNIRFWVVDEAHCVLAWKDDFRPSYRLLGPMKREICPHIPTIALSASVRPDALPELSQVLGLTKRPQRFFSRRENSRRGNLVYACLYAENLTEKLIGVLEKVKGSALICVGRQEEAEKRAQHLAQKNLASASYHSGLDHAIRRQRQQAWMDEKLRILVGTSAISMGLHKANVRLVLHLYLPESVESYYQASGRAGRDQKKAYAILLYNGQTLREARNFLNQQHPSLDILKRTYESLYNFYELGLNQGEDFSAPFCYESFVSKYRLPRYQTRYALRRLEEGAYVGLTSPGETFRQQARVRFLMDPTTLHKTETEHPELGTITQGLRRQIGGSLFYESCKIDLKSLARRLELPLEQTHTHLQRLHNRGILDYEPAQDLPHIRFLKPRTHSTNLNITAHELEEKYRVAKSRLEEMVGYAENSTQCRQVLLSKYLDDSEGAACGTCDVCLGQVRDK